MLDGMDYKLLSQIYEELLEIKELLKKLTEEIRKK